MLALVVDDSMLMRYTVCRFLEQRGYAVETASNGAEALEVLGRVQPALIVTDMMMPKMSGSELISALKSKPETAAVPIIIVAYKAGGFDRTDGSSAYRGELEQQLATWRSGQISAGELSDRVHAFTGFSLHAHLAGPDAEGLGDIFSHQRNVAGELGLLETDGRVHIENRVTGLFEQPLHVTQK